MIPTLFHIGPFPVHSFGLMVLVAFMLGVGYAVSQVRRRSAAGAEAEAVKGQGVITTDHVFDLAIAELFVSILGARILYILLQPWEFSKNPWDVFKIWTGGISIHGAIVAGSLYMWWYCRRHKLPFLKLADIGAPAFALGYAVGRVGCFLNGCCYGHACDLPWAVQFLKDGQAGVLTPPSHPTQIYATLMGLGIFAFLHFWRKRPHRDGEILLGFFGLYCVYRFIDEEFRKGATADIFIAGLTHSQVFSLIALPVILVFFFRLRRRPQPTSLQPTTVESA